MIGLHSLLLLNVILLDRYTILLSLAWLICNPMDYSPPGSSVHGISQARILEWVAISFSRGSSRRQGSNLHLLHYILYH